MTYVNTQHIFSFPIVLPSYFKLYISLLIMLFFCVGGNANSIILDLDQIPLFKDSSLSQSNKHSTLAFSLEEYIEFFVDKDGHLEFEDIKSEASKIFTKSSFTPTEINSSYWIKIELNRSSKEAKDYLFQFSSDPLGLESWDIIETYLLRENGKIESDTTGNILKNIDKPIASELNLMSYSLAKNEKATLYIRYQDVRYHSKKIHKTLNVYIDKTELLPGAFYNYPFSGKFKEHDNKNIYNFLYNHRVYVDTISKRDIDFVSANWDKLQTYKPSEYLQKPNEVYWLKTTIKTNPYLIGRQLFQISSRSTHYFTFKKIDCYVNRNNSGFEHLKTGETIVKNQRAFPSWATVIPIDFYSKDSLEIFFRLEGGLKNFNMGQILIKHIDKDNFLSTQVMQGMISGLFFGIFCVLGLIFLLLYFMDTEAINFYIFLMVLGVILALTIGDPDRHFNIFPTLRQYAIYAWCFGGVLISSSFLKFTEQYFSYDKENKISKYWVPILIALSFLAAFVDARFLINYSKYDHRLSFASHLMQILGIVMAIIMAYKASPKRANSKRFYSIAFLPVALCVSLTLFFLILGRIPSLENLPWIKHMYDIVLKNGANIVRVNLILSLCLFALSMGNRTNILKADQKLLRDIEEKNKSIVLLLKEIHHRVKNNLEIVSSLLELQSNQITDSGAKLALASSQSRVHSMAIIHQKLYQGKDISSIKMKEYFEELVEGTLYNYDMQDRVKLICTMDELEMDIDRAIPIGLIVNELITNSLKYAFVEQEHPSIRIHLTLEANQKYRLIVADNGIGKSVKNQGTGFGTQLIQLLIEQLESSLHTKDVQGTHFEITFN